MVYLLYGEERYLLENKIKRIKKEFGEIVQGINYIQIDETTVDNIISDIETPAFGYKKKMILAKNTSLFKKEKKTTKKEEKVKPIIDKLAQSIDENIQEINQIVDLIFVEEETEKNSLYKSIEKNGEIIEFKELKLPDLVNNIKKICNAYTVNIDEQTTKYFIECCGTNMQELINEIRKLIEYVGENGKITKKEIDILSTKQMQAIIFDLTDSLGKKDIKQSIQVLKDLIVSKEPIQKILITLYNHFKKLYIVKIAEKCNEDLAMAMKLKPTQMFLVTKYKQQAKYFSEEELNKILKELVELDKNYKVGLIDLQIGLESILCRYCSK